MRAFARDTLSSTPVVAAALVVLAWPVATLAEPRSVMEDSWPTALYLAVHGHFHWGPDVAYTYGPLGFLRLPISYFAGTTRLALLYVVAMQFALSVSLLYVLRRAFGVWVGIALTLLALCLVPDERAAAAAFIWAVVAVRDDAPGIVRVVFVPAAGSLAALEMLVKFNSGVVILAVAVIVALSSRRRLRDLLVLAGSFVVSFLALWSLAGQRLGDIGSYVSGTKEIVAGYAAALGGGDHRTAAAVIVALLCVAVVFAIARHARSGDGRRLAWTVYPLWAVAAFLFFKEGFVRSDTAHRPVFFGFVLCALLALAWERRVMPRMLLAAGAVTLATAWSYQDSPLTANAPASRLAAAARQLRTVLDPAAGDRAERRLAQRLRDFYRLDPRTLAELGDHPMTIMPWEDAVAYGYGLRWRPLLAIQPTQTYTRWLDDRTARALLSRDGPQRILRSPKRSLDFRNSVWDMPTTMRTILCRYRQLSASSRWQVLARTGDRCGRPTTVAIVRAHWGQRVAVPRPRPDSAMFVRIRGTSPRGLERLQALLYRPDERHIIIDYRAHRLVSGVAADGLVLWVPASADYTAPFALSQPAHTLAVRRGSGPQRGSDLITYQFEQVPVRPRAAPRTAP